MQRPSGCNAAGLATPTGQRAPAGDGFTATANKAATADRDWPRCDQAWQDAKSGCADSKCKVGYPCGCVWHMRRDRQQQCRLPPTCKADVVARQHKERHMLPSSKLPVTLPTIPYLLTHWSTLTRGGRHGYERRRTREATEKKKTSCLVASRWTACHCTHEALTAHAQSGTPGCDATRCHSGRWQ